MAQFQGPFTLAAVGSTGNNTHVGARLEADGDGVVALFKIEAVGATPTVTYQLQGSFDSTTGSDGNWFDLSSLPGDSPTEALTSVRTATGAYAAFVPIHKFAGWVRLKTSANTNVTYSATVWTDDNE